MSALFSLRPAFLGNLSMPPRVAGILRRLGEHMGRQELYRRQAPEMLENLRRVALIESTESYYDTLLLSSQGWHEGKQDVWPWTEYFLGTLLAAYSEFETRFERISSGRGIKTETVKNAIHAFTADFSLTALEKACPMVSRDMIRRILFDLRKQNQLECLGRGPSAKWRKKM